MEQILEPLERAMELTPILGELGYNESHSFNGLLQVTTDGGPSMGESQKVRGLWYAVAIWVKDGPGMGKLIADWMTDGRTAIDHASIDYARFYPHPAAGEVHRGPLHRGGAEDLQSGGASARALSRPAAASAARRSTSARRSSAAISWSSAAGSARMATPPTSTCWRSTATACRCARTNGTTAISGASPTPSISRMSEDCGIVNLSHFHMFDIEGPDHVALMEWLCAAKIGGDANIGKGIYTHFLDDEGMVRADFTVIRMADRCRVINGADAGPRDFHYMRRVAAGQRLRRHHHRRHARSTSPSASGGRTRARTLQKVVEDPDGLIAGELPLRGDQAGPDRRQGRSPPSASPMSASRAGSCTWPTRTASPSGTRCARPASWRSASRPMPTRRRMEKSLRLQNADLLTEYNLLEADLARPKVKEADFRGKAKHLEYRARDAPAGDALHAGHDRQRRCARASPAIRSAPCR